MSVSRVSYQGLQGSYSHQACKDIFPDRETIGYKSFQSAVTAVLEDSCDMAVLPVENTAAGRVMEVHNLLPDSGLHIVGEYLLPIHHNLMVPKNAFRADVPADVKKDDIAAWKNSPLTPEEKSKAFDAIVEVQSHPQALAQCRKYIQKKLAKAVPLPKFDTAGAARDISQNKDCRVAAIGSSAAADTYNMIILDENIEDISTNTTRFLVFSKKENTEKEVNQKAITTILFDTKHVPGSLLKALQVFQDHHIDLTKLETYMSGPAKPNPSFYVDVGASMFDENMKKALGEFEKHTELFRILGCYNADEKRGASNGFLAV